VAVTLALFGYFMMARGEDAISRSGRLSSVSPVDENGVTTACFADTDNGSFCVKTSNGEIAQLLTSFVLGDCLEVESKRVAIRRLTRSDNC
jgi:hypothetical protein